MLGLFWKRATEESALAATVGSFALSLIFKFATPDLPFMNRMALVFVLALILAVAVSLLRPRPAEANTITTSDVSYRTSTGFNIASIGVILILIALYATWW